MRGSRRSATGGTLGLMFALTTPCACSLSSPETPADLGLPKIELRMSDDDVIQLRHGGTSRPPLPATIELEDGTRRSARVSLSGHGTLDSVKPNLNVRLDPSTDAPSLRLKLSAQAQDPSFLRSLFALRVFAWTGLDVPTAVPVTVTLNGSTLGLYLKFERVDDDEGGFYERRGKSPERIYGAKVGRADFGPLAIADPESTFEIEHGTFHPDEIGRIAAWASSEPPLENLDFLERALDVTGALRYLAAAVFLAHWDGFANNFYLMKPENDPRLFITPWDVERVYERIEEIEMLLSRSRLFARMAEHPDLRPTFLALLRELSEGRFPPAAARAAIEEDFARIERAHRADPFLREAGKDAGAEKERLLALQARWRDVLSSYLEPAPP